MLNYNSPIKDSKNYSEIKISEAEPTAKINLRGKNRDFITKIGKELSIIPPTDPNTSSGNDSLNILWLSPDEWLIYSNNKIDQKNINDLEDRLYNSISKVKIGSVSNVTDHWVMINLKGDKVYETIMKILEHAKKNNIVAGIHNMSPEYAEKMIKKGFQFVTVGSDQRFMSAGAKNALEKIKGVKSKEAKGY